MILDQLFRQDINHVFIKIVGLRKVLSHLDRVRIFEQKQSVDLFTEGYVYLHLESPVVRLLVVIKCSSIDVDLIFFLGRGLNRVPSDMRLYISSNWGRSSYHKLTFFDSLSPLLHGERFHLLTSPLVTKDLRVERVLFRLLDILDCISLTVVLAREVGDALLVEGIVN